MKSKRTKKPGKNDVRVRNSGRRRNRKVFSELPTLSIQWLSMTKSKRVRSLDIRLKVSRQVLLYFTVMHPPLVNAPTKPQAKSKKRKGHSSSNRDTVSHSNKKSSKTHPNPELNNGWEVEVEASDDNEHTKPKKQKTATGYVAMPLRRTG
jgi:hypothetical protein